MQNFPTTGIIGKVRRNLCMFSKQSSMGARKLQFPTVHASQFTQADENRIRANRSRDSYTADVRSI